MSLSTGMHSLVMSLAVKWQPSQSLVVSAQSLHALVPHEECENRERGGLCPLNKIHSRQEMERLSAWVLMRLRIWDVWYARRSQCGTLFLGDEALAQRRAAAAESTCQSPKAALENSRFQQI